MNFSPPPGRELSDRLRQLLQRSASTCNLSASQWDTLAQEFGDEIYSEALYRLTRLEMPKAEARACFQAILEHQSALCAQLGRGVSLITATCDYFMQVNPVVRDPILVEVRLLQQKEESAHRDELTGLYNRRSFNQELPREMERFRRFGQPFSLLLLDLDHFKDFNDSYGHSAGDLALREIARILQDVARLYDRVVRYGGEEFAVILPQSTAEEAKLVAERLRSAVGRHRIRFAGMDLGALTVSVGLASYPKDGLDMEGLVLSADQAMYQAKVKRNCVRRFRDMNRGYPRYVLSDPLPFSIQTRQQSMEADAWDVSFSGLGCRTSCPPPACGELEVLLADPGRDVELKLRARVRRVKQSGDGAYNLGLSFELSGVEEQMRLMALLEGRAGATLPNRRAGRVHAPLARTA